MKKKWIKDLTDKEVINVRSEEESDRLRIKLNDLGMTWVYGVNYLHDSRYYLYRSNTCHIPSEGKVTDIGYAKKVGYTIYTLDDLLDFKKTTDWVPAPEDLMDFDEKSGDHYRKQRIETILIMERVYGTIATIQFCEMNIMKYRLRLGEKESQELESELHKIKLYGEMIDKLSNKPYVVGIDEGSELLKEHRL